MLKTNKAASICSHHEMGGKLWMGDDLGTGQVIQRDSIFVSEAGRWVIDVLANGCFDDEVAGDRLRLRDRSGSSQKDVGLRVGAVSHG